MAIHDFEPFIRKRQSLEVLKVGCIAMRHLNSNNEDFSFLQCWLFSPFKRALQTVRKLYATPSSWENIFMLSLQMGRLTRREVWSSLSKSVLY